MGSGSCNDTAKNGRSYQSSWRKKIKNLNWSIIGTTSRQIIPKLSIGYVDQKLTNNFETLFSSKP